MTSYLGPAQLAALLVLAQRGLEELHSRRNTSNLLAQGGWEVGRDYYPVVATTHLAWIASLFFLIPVAAPVYWSFLVCFLLLQIGRYWVIATLGPFWTHRIMTLESAPLVTAGPYRFMRHPNYVITTLETAILPMVFGAWALSIIMTVIWGSVLNYKIILENKALLERQSHEHRAGR